MSLIPTNTISDEAARFAAHVKTIAKESQEVLTTHTATGISPELFNKALNLDLRIQSAVGFLAKKKIGEYVTELNDLNEGQNCLANSTLVPFQITPMLLKQAAALILKEDSHPKEILAGIMEQGKVKQLLPRIYSTMAELVGTDPGTKSLSEHGQALFEDETQDRATKAQALIDMAAHAGPMLLPEEHQERMRQIGLVAERGRQAEARRGREPEKATQQRPPMMMQQSPLLHMLATHMLGSVIVMLSQKAKEITAPEADLVKPTETETTTTKAETTQAEQPTQVKIEIEPVKKEPEPTKTPEQTPVKIVKPTETETTTTKAETTQAEQPVQVKVEIEPVRKETEPTKTPEQTPVKIDAEVPPVKTKEEEAEAALRDYRELRARNSSISTRQEETLTVTTAIPQEPLAQNQHTSTELLDAELIALNEQYKAAQQKVEQLNINNLFINQELKMIYMAGVVIPARLLDAEEQLKEAQALYNSLNTRAEFIEKALEDPTGTDAAHLKKELRDLIPNILRAKQEIAVFETNVLQDNALCIKQQTDLNEYQKIAAQTKIDIEAAEAAMFEFPMLIADVQKRKEALEQTKLLETAGQKKIALRQMQADLFKPAFWKLPEPAYRSGFVMGKFKEKNISEETQLSIKEFVFAHSEDQTKTKEGTWLEDHIADDLNLIYLAFEEAVKKFG